MQTATTEAEVLDHLPRLLAAAGIRQYVSCVVYFWEGRNVPRRAVCLTPHDPGISALMRLAWEERRALLVERVNQPQFGEKSAMALPLVAAGEAMGLLYLASGSIAFTDSDFERMQDLAATFAAFLLAVRQQPALNLVRFELATVRNEHELTVDRLHILLADLERAQTAQHCLSAATTCLQNAIPGVVSVLAMLLEPPLRSLVSPYPEEFDNLSTDRGLLSRAARHGTILVRDAYNLIERERSAIAAPLSSGQVLQGFLYVGGSPPKTFTEEHKQLVTVCAVATAHALRALTLADELRTGWMTDLATGVYSHRFFKSRLSEELALCRRTEESLWLAVLDIDNFAAYNSANGHQDGDRMLRRLADLVTAELPPEGLLARYGGDEFVLTVRGQSKGEGAAFTERLRALCAEALAPLTVSLGLSASPEDGMRGLELMQAAEKALWQSKSEGRNRLTQATSKPVAS